jgi:hypothetical protein
MGKINILRLNMAERTLEHLRLPTNGIAVLDHKNRRGLLLRGARPITVRSKSRLPLWPKEDQYLLWQHGDGVPLDLSATKDYLEDSRKITREQLADTEDEATDQALIRAERPPVNYSIARMGMTAMLVTVLAVLMAFLALYVFTGRFNFENVGSGGGPGFWIVLGAIALQPRLPLKAARSWVWDAAKVEPRVAMGIFIGSAIFFFAGGYFILIGGVLLLAGEFAGAFVYLLLALLAGLGAGLPAFGVIAFSRLWLAQLILATGQDVADESWTKRRDRIKADAAHLFKERGDYVHVALSEGKPFIGREKHSGITDEEVYNGQDTADIEDMVRPTGIPWEKIEAWLLFAVIGLGFFFLLVIWQELGKAA